MEKLIDEILDIFIENVSCTHSPDSDGSGQIFDHVEYDLDEARVKEKINELMETWLPTAENIEALPEPVRKYIAELETNCDPPSMVRENVILKENCKALELKVEGLELRLKDTYKIIEAKK